jgi:hypothetical protein
MSTIWFSLIFFISLPFLAFAAESIDTDSETELLGPSSNRDADWILTFASAIAPPRDVGHLENDDSIPESEDSSNSVDEAVDDEDRQSVMLSCFRSVEDQNSFIEKFNPMGFPNPLAMNDLDRYEYVAAFFIVFIIASFIFAYL